VHYSDLFTTQEMDNAPEGDRLDVFKWLQQHRSEG